MTYDIHKEKLSIWDFEYNNARPISVFEKHPAVDYVLTSLKDQHHEALDKLNEAEAECDRSADAYQEGLNALADEDLAALLVVAEEYGCWDPETDFQRFGIPHPNSDE